jgi:hypothetical protein
MLPPPSLMTTREIVISISTFYACIVGGDRNECMMNVRMERIADELHSKDMVPPPGVYSVCSDYMASRLLQSLARPPVPDK